MASELLRPARVAFARGSLLATALFSNNPVARYRTRHRLVRSLCRRWGLSLYEEYTTWADDAECNAVWRRFPESKDRPLLERHFNLYSLAKSVRDVAGDTAECGVYRGRGSWFILSAQQGRGKHHHIFDSFEGLSNPLPEDAPERDEAFAWQKHIFRVSEEVAKKNLAAFADQV